MAELVYKFDKKSTTAKVLLKKNFFWLLAINNIAIHICDSFAKTCLNVLKQLLRYG